MADPARWWEIRPAQNRKPTSYRCPLCGHQLPALSEHMLMFPDGDRSRRRHAHTACVLRAREQGRLPTRSEWAAAHPSPVGSQRRWSPQGIFASLRLSLRGIRRGPGGRP